jgi:hypothetical protein
MKEAINSFRCYWWNLLENLEGDGTITLRWLLKKLSL